MGNASAGGREDRIFQVFAYLNTKGDFDPMILTKRVPVNPKTMLSYLLTVQEAQFGDKDYQKHVKEEFHEQWIKSIQDPTQAQIAHDVHKQSLKRLAKWDKKNKTEQLKLSQFQVTSNKDVVWLRLELSILMYSLIS